MEKYECNKDSFINNPRLIRPSKNWQVLVNGSLYNIEWISQRFFIVKINSHLLNRIHEVWFGFI